METEGPGLLFTIVAFLGGFSILVFIHEWGHFAMARLFGVKVDTFSIGMGREIVGRTDKKGTRWKISILPLGGYVKFFGDASAASNPGELPVGLTDAEKAECFHFKPLWQRALIVFAGPAVNLIGAVLVFGWLAWSNGVSIGEPVLVGIQEGSPAAAAGLLEGDRILSIDGAEVDRFSDVAQYVVIRANRPVDIEIARESEHMLIRVMLGAKYKEDRFGNQYAEGFLGVQGRSKHYTDLGPLDSLYEGTRQTVGMSKMMVTTLGEIILGVRSMKELGGPIRIANMVGEAASISLTYFIWVLGLLSLNLGIVNLLPIPVLDGGHLLFYTLEGLKGSPLSRKAQEAGFVAGLALMLIFMLLVTLNDLQSIAL